MDAVGEELLTLLAELDDARARSDRLLRATHGDLAMLLEHLRDDLSVYARRLPDRYTRLTGRELAADPQHAPTKPLPALASARAR